MQPARFTPDDLFAHTKPAGVEKIVLIQMSYYGFDNSYMTDMIAKYPEVFSGVAIIDHTQPHVAKRMSELSAKGVRGFRLYPPGDGKIDWTIDEGIHRIWRAAGELDLSVCLLINPSDLAMTDKMCEMFPGTRVVIDHFARIGVSGNIDPTLLDRLCALAKHDEVFVKISAFYALGKKKAPYDDLIPMIRRLLDAFGTRRLMWASDNPYQVQPPHRYVDSLSLIRDRIDGLSDGDKEDLLRRTAERVFFRK
jgi:predicted TIM-barrel fold metal-dependent hydrolase